MLRRNTLPPLFSLFTWNCNYSDLSTKTILTLKKSCNEGKYSFQFAERSWIPGVPDPQSTPQLLAGWVCQLHLTVLLQLLPQTVLKGMAEAPRVTSPLLSSAECHDNFSWAGAWLGAMARQEQNLFLLQRHSKSFSISQCQSVLAPFHLTHAHVPTQLAHGCAGREARFSLEGKLDSC